MALSACAVSVKLVLGIIEQSSCDTDLCFNDGYCVVSDERYISVHLNKSTCICREEHSGEHCEQRQTRIDILFDDKIIIPSSLLVHLITVQKIAVPIRTSMMKKIAFDQNSLVLYTSVRFHIAFAQLLSNYYLIVFRKQAVVSETISTEIIPSHRYASVDELFNETIINQSLLKRIKLYHIPCRERRELVCFNDSIHLCLCNLARQANCFEFQHNMTYDCDGLNVCQNGGQCFQDDPKCQTPMICVCPECYYRSRCQFSTKGSTLSLNIILGYGIRPNQQINQQSLVVKISLVLTMTMLSCGLSIVFSQL